jgi:nucleoside-diphosphate-sugar epimerase
MRARKDPGKHPLEHPPAPLTRALPVGTILFNPSAALSLAETAERKIGGAHPGYRRWRLYRPLVVSGAGRPRSPCRRRARDAVPDAESRVLGEIAPGRDWGGALRDLDIVVHLAQRAHVPPSQRILSAEPAAAATLARRAAISGVRRFVYVSSIKAMGEATAPGRPFRAEDRPLPEDAYGRAKLATERALDAVATETRLELVILRPPLVYGPGVGGNFRALLRLAGSGLPLPLAGLDNRRSLLARDNLVDLIATACAHPAIAPAGGGRVLLASDGVDLATPELIRILATARGRNVRLFPFPTLVFAGLRRLPGVGPAVSRLTLSLQIDDAATRVALGWRPPVAAKAALTETARAFGSG